MLVPSVVPTSESAALAALVHAMLIVEGGFKVVEESEEGGGEGGEGEESLAPVASELEDASFGMLVFPAEWQAGGPDLFTFQYRHTASSLSFEVKILRMGSKVIVTGMIVETEALWSLELKVPDQVHADALQGWDGDWSILFKDINALSGLVRDAIVRKLVPKEGYEPMEDGSSTNATSNTNTGGDPLAAPPVGNAPPPLGPYAPFGGGLPDPLGGPGGIGGGGMLVGPGHPGFGGGHGLPGMGGLGGPRYDPIGPGDLGPDNDMLFPPGVGPGFGMGGYGPGSGRGRGRGRGRRGGRGGGFGGGFGGGGGGFGGGFGGGPGGFGF